jgi:hypothetical protein
MSLGMRAGATGRGPDCQLETGLLGYGITGEMLTS